MQSWYEPSFTAISDVADAMASKAAGFFRRRLQLALDAVLLVDQRPYARGLPAHPQAGIVLFVSAQKPPKPPAAP
ncbi:MAG TPA: hypothetical protein VFE60_06435 [Roseiarcus sp.]|nr:hypothetical protein [Roseiarcus sp.]